MPQISLTDFVDIVSTSGTPKATKVRQIKNRPKYSPAGDFYKRIREGIIESHKNGKGKKHIDATLVSLTDVKKQTAYPQIASGYKKWLGKKKLEWFEPPNDLFSSNGVDITVNPELGLIINGERHLIKLYFKNEPLSKNRIHIITHLMATVLSGACSSKHPTTMSIVDIRRSKLFSPTVPIPELNAIIKAEMAYIAELWLSL